MIHGFKSPKALEIKSIYPDEDPRRNLYKESSKKKFQKRWRGAYGDLNTTATGETNLGLSIFRTLHALNVVNPQLELLLITDEELQASKDVFQRIDI